MQTTFAEIDLGALAPIVNIASVRHLSPFRYPGGKTWLVPKVLSHLRAFKSRPQVFVDPFLGGGSIPLAALMEGCVDRAVLCEIDTAVAAVWTVVFSSDFEKLCSLILKFEIDRDRVIDLLSREPSNIVDKAFQTVIKNRTFRGGIMAEGASLIKVGENGRGVASRWYPETLVKRIRILNELSGKVTFIDGDGFDSLTRYASDPDAFIFIDPPYTAGLGKRAGNRLYQHSQVDHDAIFDTLAEGKSSFMMTYDDDVEVLNLAKRSGFILQHVAMKNTHHRCMNELLITRA